MVSSLPCLMIDVGLYHLSGRSNLTPLSWSGCFEADGYPWFIWWHGSCVHACRMADLVCDLRDGDNGCRVRSVWHSSSCAQQIRPAHVGFRWPRWSGSWFVLCVEIYSSYQTAARRLLWSCLFSARHMHGVLPVLLCPCILQAPLRDRVRAAPCVHQGQSTQGREGGERCCCRRRGRDHLDGQSNRLRNGFRWENN